MVLWPGSKPLGSWLYFTLLFAMLQLHSLALLQVLAALAGSVFAFDQSSTTLEIVNKNIQPDGYPRP